MHGGVGESVAVDCGASFRSVNGSQTACMSRLEGDAAVEEAFRLCEAAKGSIGCSRMQPQRKLEYRWHYHKFHNPGRHVASDDSLFLHRVLSRRSTLCQSVGHKS